MQKRSFVDLDKFCRAFLIYKTYVFSIQLTDFYI